MCAMGMPLLGDMEISQRSLLVQPMQESFTFEEQELASKGSLSSCHWEMKKICLLGRTCIRANSEKFREAVLLVLCDSQGAVSNVNNMNWEAHTPREFMLRFEAAAQAGVEVRVQWVARKLLKCKELACCLGVMMLGIWLWGGGCTGIMHDQLPEGGDWGFPTGDWLLGQWTSSCR